MTRIAVKYGLLITLSVIAWVVIAHLLVPDPTSNVHKAGAGIFFNVVEILGIYFGIREKGRSEGGRTSFKDGLKTGMIIAFVYALTAALFFLAELLVIGPQLMAAEPGAAARSKPFWQVAAGAFAGLFVFAIFFGLIYSTVISSMLARRRRTA
ncbi:MAG: DUF4199 family protein [Pyrinomonadaceae bacterium]